MRGVRRSMTGRRWLAGRQDPGPHAWGAAPAKIVARRGARKAIGGTPGKALRPATGFPILHHPRVARNHGFRRDILIDTNQDVYGIGEVRDARHQENAPRFKSMLLGQNPRNVDMIFGN